MSKTLTMLTCGGLVATSAWLTGRLKAQDEAKVNPFERQKGDAPAGAGPAASAQSGVDVNRRKVDDYMRQARLAMRQGDTAEALRLAKTADSLARQFRVPFRPDEATPAQLITVIEGPVAGSRLAESRPARDAAPASPEQQEAQELLQAAQEDARKGNVAAARKKVEQASQLGVTYSQYDLQPEQVLADIARAQKASPEGPSDTFQTAKTLPKSSAAPRSNPFAGRTADAAEAPAGDDKARAAQLVSAARAALEAGRFDEARGLAEEASQIDVAYDVVEDRPEVVLKDIQQQSGKVVFSGRKAAAPAPKDASDEGRDEALKLIAEARAAMQAGDMATARRKAEQAEKIDATFKVFDDRPELVLSDAGKQPVTQRKAGAQVQTVSATGSPAERQDRQKALGLLAQARDAAQKGDTDRAEALVREAQKVDVAYDLFDDRPELASQDIDRLVASRGADRKAAPATAPQGKSLDQQKAEALELLAEARSLMDSGDAAGARNKARQAAQYNVTYEVFEDSPELLLTQIERSNRAIARRGAQPAMPAEEAAAGSAPVQVVVNEVPARQPIVTAGLSAPDLYRQGVACLKTGDRMGAYESFLACYNSGEEMPPQVRQQLQDKLRELAPNKKGNNVRLVNNEQAASDQGDGLPIMAPGHLDSVANTQTAKLERLRTETLNAIHRADRMREKQPEQAQQLLAQTLAAIENSGIDPKETERLAAAVRSEKDSIDAYVHQHAPVIAMERKNTETRNLVQRQIDARVRVEQEVADLVDKFNEFMDQKRFAEAHAVAKQAKELDGDNPVCVTMELKSMFALRVNNIEQLKADKEKSFYDQLWAAETSAINPVADDNHPMAFAKDWNDIKARRKGSPTQARDKTETERRVYQCLTNPVSLHFDNEPLFKIMQHIADSQGINVVVDEGGLQEVQVTQSTPISINVDGVQLRSALNLMLGQLHLDYTIENEVLNITSQTRQQGGMKVEVYQVADLVVPINVRNPSVAMEPANNPLGLAGGAGMPQIPAQINGDVSLTGLPQAPIDQVMTDKQRQYQFEALTGLITGTIAPDSWAEFNGQGSVEKHESTLSLVIRQTQKVHQEISDLLEQLRRLQDLQVTIEVRFITVSDDFFEQIGVDFDFNLQDTIGGPAVDNNFNPLRPFGAVDPTNGSTGGVGTTTAGTTGGTAGTTGTAGTAGGTSGGVGPFAPGPRVNLVGRDNWPSRTVVGMSNPGTFSGDLDLPFRQGSFGFSEPSFGRPDLNAGMSFGLAILSDLEAFLFIRAAQGDRRSNVMFAPKVTLFNGMFGNVTSGTRRPFVVSLIPVASAFSVGFQPIIQTIQEGSSLTVRAVISADRRYVRLAVLPTFQNITAVFTFSFIGASTGVGGLTGGLAGGAGGGTGGGTGGTTGGTGGTTGGTAGTTGGTGGVSGAQVTVQQPVVDVVTVDTVVSVPDGGTVLLGGVKQIREQRNMAGVPILNKIPYISRLFRNTGVGRETSSLMMMVTPRIIIQEEEEELLGIPN